MEPAWRLKFYSDWSTHPGYVGSWAGLAFEINYTLYKRIVGHVIRMDTNWTPFLQICVFLQKLLYVVIFSRRLAVTEAFNSTFRYLEDSLSIENDYFEQMVDTAYSILKLNKTIPTNTQRWNTVAATSRHDIVSTLMRCCINVMCPQGNASDTVSVSARDLNLPVFNDINFTKNIEAGWL